MEQDFYNDDFDFFLKQKADEYYMYPAESVWKRVRKNLFWHKNWLSVAGSVLVLGCVFFIPESFYSGIFSQQATGQPINEGSSKSAFPSRKKIHQLRIVHGNLSGSRQQIPAPALPAIADNIPYTNNNEFHGLETMRPLRSSASLITHEPKKDIDIASHFTTTKPVVKDDSIQNTPETEVEETPEKDEGIANWLQDMAVIRLTPKRHGRFNLQFYFSPLVSYRTLTDNNNKTRNGQGNTPVTTNQIDINQYVDHQPSIGVELGSNLLFKATKNLTFKTGVQLNYSRYTIKAYKAGYEKASIALNTFGPIADIITSYTTIRNFDGYLQEQLQNQYVQVSVPFGAELKLLGNKRLQINIAGTIQPTLLLFNDTYLLSTDYLNYTKEPSLVRKWNVHTSAEAYVSYQFANVRWQVGPQFRYQLLSSYNDRYPIREYLMEYGIKFGISKTLR